MPARILVVDDMIPSLRMLSAKLDVKGYDVSTAQDGPSALESILHQPPDLVLLDVMMPGMDGYEVCRRIKEDPRTRDVPVIMVSALSGPGERLSAAEMGADDFLTKPVGDPVLYSRIRAVLRLRRLNEQRELRGRTAARLGLGEVPEGPPSPARVLVIDRSAGSRANLKAALAACGRPCEVEEHAFLERETLARSAGRADLVILGVEPRIAETRALLARLRGSEEGHGVPIMLIGDESQMAEMVETLDLGADDYLLRPLDQLQLAARVRCHIASRRAERGLDETLAGAPEALRDAATGLYGARFLDAHLETLVDWAHREARPLSLLAMAFEGDGAAIPFKTIVTELRRVDLVARRGGQRLDVLLPGLSFPFALRVGEYLRTLLAESGAADPRSSGRVRVRFGVATLGADCPTAAALRQRVEQALTEACQAESRGPMARDTGRAWEVDLASVLRG